MAATFRHGSGFARFSKVFTSSGPSDPDPRLSVAAETALRYALLKILKTLNSRKYKAVRDEARKQMNLLESLVKDAESAKAIDQSQSTDSSSIINDPKKSNYSMRAPTENLGTILQQHACEFFQPFKLACESGSSKAILVSLDGLQVRQNFD